MTLARILPPVLLGLLLMPAMAGATPTPTPTPQGTCAPCSTDIEILSIDLEDDHGSCTDGDGLPDAGELVGFRVAWYSADSCCWYPCGDVTVATTYPHLTFLSETPDQDPALFTTEVVYYYQVEPEAACLDEATVEFHGYADDGMYVDTDDEVRVYTLEVDDDGMGGYVCDDTPCEASPTPTPPPEVPAAGAAGLSVLLLGLGALLAGVRSSRRSS